ncbi:unnamed protein product [Ostreobium quekettii]|uniref:B9 domain-containing protein 2 n=1 Tax=Ostreobium quekettii TaxID=121088 RepID=A0A8S1J2N1_9CHLO|nr:unnamed protein product [Ostreobium quekettii]|eukprot:evm.model.scf_183.5 EVM.evm.TU.scf_183.5   scf_183:23124-26213(+)
MAEFHALGEIAGASGFEDKSVFCKWGVSAGECWDLLEGIDKGQTQVDHPEEGEPAVWSHPLDLHYSVKGLVGWPKLHFQVWSEDTHGRFDLCGYGFCHIPTAPGMYELDCPTWVPEGSAREELLSCFLGRGPRLKAEEVVYTPGDRFRLQTKAAGVVLVKLGVVMKDFDLYSVRC